MATAALCVPLHLNAQEAATPAPVTDVQPLAPPSPDEKWDFFKDETFAPYTLLASAVNAGVSQALRSDPQYGVGGVALAKRFGATAADSVSQNYFSDYVMASVLHEDTRYRRRGEKHGFWSRFGYAVTRAFVTRTDAGGSTANWSNFIGCGLQAGLSNAYYPTPSRNLSATAINWANSIGAAGFGNLFPEFLPDFKRFLKRIHL
jgi:hypothetical protein